ncbi:MAG: apolipoprotein N-acyltransferase [Candidatus Bipolaricaulaceae bacterium]
MRGFWRAGLALVGALLLWASFFPGLGALVWIALAPFFLALQDLGPKRGAFWGFLFGFAFFLLEFSSLLSLRPFIGPMAYGVIFLLSLYGGIFLAAFGTLAGWRSSPLILASAWALIEAARGAGPLGFTFGSVPVALAGSPFVAASGLAGPWLLSLAVALTAALLAQGLRKPKILPLALLPPLLLWGIGEALPEPKAVGETRLALVQPDISQAERLDRTKLPEILARYELLLGEVPENVDLIVIPENATPAFLRIEREYLEPFLRAAEAKGVPLMVGTADIEGGKIRNTMLLLTPDGRESVVYAKMHLVPFGEYVPGRKLWERLGLASLIDQFLPYDQTPGERLEPVGIYGVVICFESSFPGPTRVLARKGAELLLVSTNDAWFGRTRILWEHYAMGSLRAAETGRVCIQVGQTGITGAWDPKGLELVRFPIEAGVYTMRVERLQGTTPFVWAGDYPALLFASGLLVFSLVKRALPWRARPHLRRSAANRD